MFYIHYILNTFIFDAAYIIWATVKYIMMQNPVNRQTFDLFYIPSVEGEQMLEDSSIIHKEKKNIWVT